jgi:hypothetical protein
MRTYAEYLNTMTVKALNVIARDMGLKGYSKLRKAELVAFIDNAIVVDCVDVSADFLHFAQFGEWPVKILDVTVEADHTEIREIMAQVAPVTFSQAPAKAPQMPAKPRNVAPVPVTMVEVEEDSTEDLIEAYRFIRARRHTARGALHISLSNKLRNLSAALRARKVYMREV